MKYGQLSPGDKVTLAGKSAILITWTTPHPIYHQLALFIWRLDDGTISLDALHPAMELISSSRVDSTNRPNNLREALLHK